PETARGRHLGNARDPSKLPLQGRSDGGSHRLRTSTGQTGSDGNRRKVDLWQWSNGKKTERNRTGKKDGDGDERGRNGTTNERRGKVGRKIHALVSRLVRSRFVNRIAYIEGEAGRGPIKREIHDRCRV